MSDRRRPGRGDESGRPGAEGFGPDELGPVPLGSADLHSGDHEDSDDHEPSDYDSSDYDSGGYESGSRDFRARDSRATNFHIDDHADGHYEDVDAGSIDDDTDRDVDDSGDDAVVEKGRGRRFGRRTKERRRTRPAISGMRVLAGTVASVVVVIALFVVAYFTPLMSVRSVDVTGNSAVAAEEITSAAAVPAGEPLLQVDAAAAARRVSMIPRIASVRVKREYPSTISISVVERIAVVFTERDGQKYLMDALGFEFAQQDPPPGLAQLRTQNPGSGDPSTRAALTVMAEVPPYVSGQIAAIEVSSPVNIVLVLKDKRTVVWGDDRRNAEKAETLRHVLTQEGTQYNVSSPSNPTFK